MWRNTVLDCIIFTQICIGGENVGKIWGVWEKEKVLQVMTCSTSLCFETVSFVLKEYPEPGSKVLKSRKSTKILYSLKSFGTL